MDDLGDAMTQGWWRRIKGLVDILIFGNFMLLAVFLKKRMGLRLFSLGTWFWLGAYLFVLTFIAMESWNQHELAGNTEEILFSVPLLYLHGQLFVFFMLAKWGIAYWSLRSDNPRWFRDRLAIGESEIYPLIYFLLKPLKLAGDDETRPAFWKMTEAKWVQFFEPILIFYLGYQIMLMGYTTYGHFVMIAACCYGRVTIQAHTNRAKVRQAEREAQTVQQMMSHPVEEEPPAAPVIRH